VLDFVNVIAKLVLVKMECKSGGTEKFGDEFEPNKSNPVW
jgi:hypothetical protein